MKKPGKTILQVRDVPDDIHKAAKYAALDAGISLNKWIVEAIRKAAPLIKAHRIDISPCWCGITHKGE